MRVSDQTLLAGAKPCPFCTADHGLLGFNNGAVFCDVCQAEGPFCGSHFDHPREGELKQAAILLWNKRHA